MLLAASARPSNAEWTIPVVRDTVRGLMRLRRIEAVVPARCADGFAVAKVAL